MKPMRGSSSRATVVAITSITVAALATTLAAYSLANPDDSPGACESQSVDAPGQACAKALAGLFEQGKAIFRFDTFGDEDYWGGKLQLHKAIEGAALGGVGPGVSPKTALTVAGLKVDVDALPGNLQAKLKQGKVDLDSPATTLALLQLNAVVGVKGFFDKGGSLNSIGITCALCHSTVDDSFAPGIGKRLDGWPNRDLNPGAILALSPAFDAAAKAQLNAWGPGKYDPRHNIDGLNKAAVIPPAYGLAGIDSVTFTGDGSELAYWNRYVAVTQMGGLGTFTEPRLGLSITHGNVDLVSSKLPALQAYQLSIAAPAPPAGSFDPAAAARGQQVFAGAGGCAACHSGALFTDANSTLHPPADSMAEPESPSYAARSATKRYRTSPLRGVWQHAPYFHDGSAATLEQVVATYNARRSLGLTAQQSADLVQYLKSL